ncbi:MAG: hypothetical protein WC729_29240 [Sphingomonas sp.]|uniref:hypothetical protein n=1 Tax=Sphingomonas sp. TaxID=28214 RepID=UPI003562501D
MTTPIRDDYQPIRDDYQDEYYDDGTVTNNTPVEVQGEQLLIVGDKGYGVTVKKPASTLLPLLLGGGAGFLVGGPLGAAVGAAGAALLGGKKTAVVPTDNVDEVEVAPEAAPVYEEQESSTGWEWADDRNAAQDFGAVDPVEREKARQAREAARSTTPKLIGRNTAAATRRPSSEAKNREAAKREDASKSFVTAPVAAGGAALLWLLLR